jgi:dTDP-4-amino-4,6-dideoxygalactose transaminase
MSAAGDRFAGAFGDMAALSFHDSKNIISGEGGALLIRREELIARAEIAWEKGTDRLRFNRGEVDRYRWVDAGSSFVPSELSAAFLAAQLEEADSITASRLATWRRYHEALEPLEKRGVLTRPRVPAAVRHNGHIFHIRVPEDAQAALDALQGLGVRALTHYVPLHSSPAGLRFGRAAGDLPNTEAASRSLIRLPIWNFMPDAAVERVIEAVERVFRDR